MTTGNVHAPSARLQIFLIDEKNVASLEMMPLEHGTSDANTDLF